MPQIPGTEMFCVQMFLCPHSRHLSSLPSVPLDFQMKEGVERMGSDFRFFFHLFVYLCVEACCISEDTVPQRITWMNLFSLSRNSRDGTQVPRLGDKACWSTLDPKNGFSVPVIPVPAHPISLAQIQNNSKSQLSFPTYQEILSSSFSAYFCFSLPILSSSLSFLSLHSLYSQ